MQFSHEESVSVGIGAVDLATWIFGMSDAEYRACAKGHKVMGIDQGGARAGVVNVEQMGGILIYQHYRTQLAQRDHVAFLSSASEAFLLHLVPYRMRVNWEMRLLSAGRNVSTLRCNIGFEAPGWVNFAGLFIGANRIVKNHLIEETRGFARDIEQKFAA